MAYLILIPVLKAIIMFPFTKISFFGCCTALSLAKFVGLNLSGKNISNIIISNHIAEHAYENPFFYEEKGALTMCSPHSQNRCLHVEATTGLPYFSIPHHMDEANDFLYCFASPIYFLHPVIRQYTFQNIPAEKYFCSYNAFKAATLYKVAPMFSMLHRLKDMGIKLVIAEGQTLFPPPWPASWPEDVFKKMYPWCIQILKEETLKLDVPLFEIPSDLVAENGFTKKEYQVSPSDCQHPNKSYWKIVANAFLDFLKGHESKIMSTRKIVSSLNVITPYYHPITPVMRTDINSYDAALCRMNLLVQAYEKGVTKYKQLLLRCKALETQNEEMITQNETLQMKND